MEAGTHDTFVGMRAVGQLGAGWICCLTLQVPVLAPFAFGNFVSTLDETRDPRELAGVLNSSSAWLHGLCVYVGFFSLVRLTGANDGNPQCFRTRVGLQFSPAPQTRGWPFIKLHLSVDRQCKQCPLGVLLCHCLDPISCESSRCFQRRRAQPTHASHSVNRANPHHPAYHPIPSSVGRATRSAQPGG